MTPRGEQQVIVLNALNRGELRTAEAANLLGLSSRQIRRLRRAYSDRHGIFRRTAKRSLTLQEQLAGGPAPTQVERALQELGIRWIPASSPQAKGRIERLFGTFQDRLRSELRLAGVRDRAGANAFLVEASILHHRTVFPSIDDFVEDRSAVFFPIAYSEMTTEDRRAFMGECRAAMKPLVSDDGVVIEVEVMFYSGGKE